MIKTTAIDWPLCLQRGNHQAQQAHELLSLLINELPAFEKQIQHAYQHHETMLLNHLLKKCLDACCYTGVPELQQQIEGLLKQLKQQVWPSPETMNQLTHNIQAILEESKHLVEVLP